MSGDRRAGARTPFKVALATGACAALAVALAAPMAGHGRRAPSAPRRAVAAPLSRTPDPPPPLAVTVAMRPREGLAAALERAGADQGEAARAAGALGEDFDIVNPHPGLRLDLTLIPAPANGRPRLVGLSLRPDDDRRVSARLGPGGAWRVSDAPTAVYTISSRIDGTVEGSLYLSMIDAGVAAPTAAKVATLFGRHLDLGRDIESGDRFALIFEQPRAADGRTAGAGALLYAEVAGRAGAARLYRFQPPGGGAPDYLDGRAGPARALLLRTPVDGARVTSGFGPRLHPILGFTRLHQGVDFGASEGAPVLAAGDGVVEEARWAGGYGRWLKIRHAGGLETGYAHLSAWAAGVAPGERVRQGEVVAFVGATGLATGPHLHYEVFAAGRRVDPRLAGTAVADGADPARQVAFRAQKARIDAVVEAGG